ncbi:hypothetical protein EPO04_02745 [Patescibacteria group bacterium]|nr:MAG: hypothetical protein EPO04_02745 [Patescibacteria group bacterium]
MTTFSKVKDVLEQANTDCERLRLEADARLQGAQDAEGYRAKLVERAQIVAALGKKVEPLLGNSPAELDLYHRILTLAGTAEHALKEYEQDQSGTLGLGVILHYRDDTTNDPNRLERLVELAGKLS